MIGCRLCALMIAVLVAGCATHVMTSGRVVLQERDSRVTVGIDERDRALIAKYYGNKKGVPPGPAQRRGGLPSGLARRDTLPPGLRGEPLPADLERQLSPLPRGYMRVRIGTDVVLLESRTRVIFDVVYGVAG